MTKISTLEVVQKIWNEIAAAEGLGDAERAGCAVREIDGLYQFPMKSLEDRQVDCHVMFIPWSVQNMAAACNVAQVWWIKFIDGEPSYVRIF